MKQANYRTLMVASVVALVLSIVLIAWQNGGVPAPKQDKEEPKDLVASNPAHYPTFAFDVLEKALTTALEENPYGHQDVNDTTWSAAKSDALAKHNELAQLVTTEETFAKPPHVTSLVTVEQWLIKY